MNGTGRMKCLPVGPLAGIVCARTMRGDAVVGHNPDELAWDGPEEAEVAIAFVLSKFSPP